MPQIPFCIVDAFTDTAFQGNPAGVFFDDRAELTEDACLRLCAEVSLESAFILPASAGDSDFRLRYFTGVTEVPLCGHATVAAIAALVDAARIAPPASLRVQTNVGILSIDLRTGGDGWAEVTLHQNAPQFATPLGPEWPETLAGVLGIDSRSITDTDLPIQAVSTGTPWLLVPVMDRESVDTNDALDNAAVITHLSRQHGVFGIYLFTVERKDDAISIWSRCFAPLADLPEDPVTGSASGCLGGYLAEHGVMTVPENGMVTLISQQGFGGGRGGTVKIQVAGQAGEWRSSITGTALVTAAGMFSIPNY